MSAAPIVLVRPTCLGARLIAAPLKALHLLLCAPEYIFLIALIAMLFCPPDLRMFPADRLTFLLLVAVASVRLLLRCDRLRTSAATWPMLALLFLALGSTVSQPYDAKAWSILAAQWIVPVTMFHLGGSVFSTAESRRKLQWLSIAALFYLSLTSVFWLLDVKSLIFPRFILDESIGIHFDRARGPFLQAVANGVSTNVLAIVALDSLDRRTSVTATSRFPMGGTLVATLFVAVPLAILATKTRAVWLAAVISAVLIVAFARGRRSRTAVTLVALVVVLATAFVFLLQTRSGELSHRLQDRSPIEFRLDMYRAGWQMFAERPLLGWGSDAEIQPQVEQRVSSFRPEYYLFHNTYLQLAVQHGAVGLVLYLWMFIAFFRLGARTKFSPFGRKCPFGRGFGLMWRIMLFVYLLNATVVVMSYQFLNGYVFTIAGVLAAQQKSQNGGVEASNERCLPL